jgi:transcriptional regulator with XRE-family HTH domain
MRDGHGQAMGLRIRQRRIAMNLSEELAAAALGVSTQHYQAMEAGDMLPTRDQLRDARVALRAKASAVFEILARPSPLNRVRPGWVSRGSNTPAGR